MSNQASSVPRSLLFALNRLVGYLVDVLFIAQLTLIVCLINLCPQFGLELLSVCNNKRATRLATPFPVRSLWPSISHRKTPLPRPVINSTTMKLYLVIPRAVLCWVRCVYKRNHSDRHSPPTTTTMRNTRAKLTRVVSRFRELCSNCRENVRLRGFYLPTYTQWEIILFYFA